MLAMRALPKYKSNRTGGAAESWPPATPQRPMERAMVPAISVTVGPSPLKILGKLAIGSVAFTAVVGILILFMGFLGSAWILSLAWIILICTVALLACYCAIAVIVAGLCGLPRVEIGADGFVDYGIVGHRSRRWSDIEGSFVVIRVGLQRVVAYHLTAAAKESIRLMPGTSLRGYDEALLICGELEMGTAQLAEVLNQWKLGLPTPP